MYGGGSNIFGGGTGKIIVIFSCVFESSCEVFSVIFRPLEIPPGVSEISSVFHFDGGGFEPLRGLPPFFCEAGSLCSHFECLSGFGHP